MKYRAMGAVFALMLVLGSGAWQSRSSAQGTPETDEGTMGVSGTVTLCSQPIDVGAANPNELCEAISGIGLTFADEAGELIEYCIAEAADVPDPKAAGCGVDIPFSSTVIVTLDESTIPAGYHLYSSNPQSFTAPDGPPKDLYAMPFFVILPDGTPSTETTGMAAAVAYCDADPRIPGNQTYKVCNAVTDVHIVFTNEAGDDFAECFTRPGKIEGGSNAGVCGIQVPLGSTTVATVDLSTTSSDYTLISEPSQAFEAPDTPPTGILDFPYFQFVANSALAEEEEVPTETAGEAPTEEAPGIEGRTVVLYTGDCDDLGDEVAVLNDVLPEIGELVGDEKAIAAELSVTHGAAFFLDEAIDGGYALVVYEDETTGTPVACGDLGGVNTHDGMLPIGLGEVDDSGIVGTAVLSYNDFDETTTDVTIVISAELLPEPEATPDN